MENISAVRDDLSQFYRQIKSLPRASKNLTNPNTWLVIFDIAVNWALIVLAVFLVSAVSLWLTPIALIIIGNRQRALGNILHDCGHINLSQNKKLNDLIGYAFLAAPLFNSLALYRSSHFQHHARLGDAATDPDYIHDSNLAQQGDWFKILQKNVLHLPTFKSSLLGHIGRINARQSLYMVSWWCSLLIIINFAFGSYFLWYFISLWLLAKASVFHIITTFREICDHSGLHPGGVFSFSRNVIAHNVWGVLFHPHNNGYHLTHHLGPNICYRNLPAAHQQYLAIDCYLQQGHVCHSYFLGENAAVKSWLACAQ